MGRKAYIHYSLLSVCVSFIAACTGKWCYDSGLFGKPRTVDEKEVTCPKCKKAIEEINELNKSYS